MKNHIPHPSFLNSNKRINWPILETKIHIYFHLRIKVKEEQSWKSKRKEKKNSLKIPTNALSKKKKKKKKPYKWNEYIQLSNVMTPTSATISHMTSCEWWRKHNGLMWVTSPSLIARHMASCAINCSHSITLFSFSIFTIQPPLTLIIS